MGTIFLDMALITGIVCFVIDIADFPRGIGEYIYQWINDGKPMPDYVEIRKPFSCSLCMTFWCTLGYLTIMGKLSLMGVAICCFFSMNAEVITSLLYVVRDLLGWCANLIGRVIK